MDVTLIPTSAYDLPSSRRVGAIVHDGATDMRVWPGPGADRELMTAYGDELQEQLQRETADAEGAMEIGSMLRVHRGKLHCDFLLWIASRPPEEDGVRATAPTADIIENAVMSALKFVAERSVNRVAFPTLGEGPEQLDSVERLVLIARTANAYYEECFKAGRSPVLEEVLICHPNGREITAARKTLGKTVKTLAKPAKPAEKKPAKKRATRKTTTKKKKGLTEDEIGAARATAQGYDRGQVYTPGDWMIHTKFGVGRVEEITPEGYAKVLFESGRTRRLLQNR